MPTRARRAAAAAAVTLVCACLAFAGAARAQEASTAVYVRTDTDRTTVISPRLRVGGQVSDSTRLDVVYGVDVWTSASIDIRTSASQWVTRRDTTANSARNRRTSGDVHPVTEQRDEIDASLTQEFDDVKLAASYRFSTEPDYVSNGGSLGVSFDFAEHAATLALSGSASFDDVGRAGDPSFSRGAQTLGGRLSFTQLIDPKMLVQVMYDVSAQDGFLSSPYRFVAIELDSSATGVTDARCPRNGTFYACLPESNPNQRLRHAFGVHVRRALSTAISAGLAYRLYIDDWDVMSHTVTAELGWIPSIDTSLGLRYRFYTQTAASHYAAHFNSPSQAGEFFTSDKELSTFQSHRIGVELDHEWQLDSEMHTLMAALSVGPTIYLYSDFPPLDSITALEVTLALVMKR
jgi:hypothetical protein